MHAVIKGLVLASLLAAGFAVHHHHDWFFGTQDDKKQDAKKQDAGAMAMPEPTAEHKWLAEGTGKWKVTGTMHGPTGPSPMNGIQTNTMQQGGLWQIVDFKTDDGKFTGHGVTGFDPAKKKFVGVWVDNWTMAFEPSEGTLSADKKTATMTVGHTDPESGKRITMTETITRKDDKSCRFEMTMPGPDGKPMKVIELDYTKM